ncbi:MAG: alpha/beta hydrolase [Amylibacter sp.]
MNSLRLQIASAFTRLVIKPWVRRSSDPEIMRQLFETHAKRMHVHPPFADYRNGNVGDVPVLWVRCGEVKTNDVLLYIHGGGFIVGSPNTHKHMVAYLAQKLGMEAVMPRYRLAPEHPFPAGFDDVVAIYRGLLARGLRADQIVVAGDSAGGALMLALLAYLSDEGMDMPQSAVAISPVVDIAASFDSMKTNANSDVLLIAERFDELGGMYMGDGDRSQPYASPFKADFEHCPPILFHCCDREILRDDTLEMQRKLVALGHDVLVRSWPNAFHVFHIMCGHFPEARTALDDMVTFIMEQRSQGGN